MLSEIGSNVLECCLLFTNITILNSVIKIGKNVFPPNCKIINED